MKRQSADAAPAPIATALLQAIFEQIDEGILVLDAERRILVANPAAQRIWGAMAEQLVGQPFSRCVVEQAAFPDTLALTHDAGAFAVAGPPERLGVRLDGRRFPLALRGEVVALGDQSYLLLRAHDLTEQRLAEQRAAAQQVMTRILTEAPAWEDAIPAILQGIGEALGWHVAELWLYDAAEQALRCYAVWNQPAPELERFTSACLERSFRPEQGLPGRIWREGVPRWIEQLSSESNFPRRALARAASLSSGFGVPIRVQGDVLGVLELFHRERQPYDMALLDLMTSLGSQLGLFTQRKRAEEALRFSEARFRALFEQAPLSIQIIAPDGITRAVNRAWEQLWGVGLAQLAGYNMLQDQQLVERGIMAFIQQGFAGQATPIPAILYDPNQTIPDQNRYADPRRWVSAVIFPVMDASGQVREVVLIHQDVTAEYRAIETRELALARHRDMEGRLTYLTQAMQTLLTSLDLEQMLPALLDLAEQLLVADGYAIWRRHSDEPRWEVLASRGLSQAYHQLAAHEIAGTRRTLERPIIVEDLAAAPGMAQRRELYQQEGLRSMLVIPLQIHGENAGSLAFYYRERHSFDELAVGIATALSALAATAITTAELYSQAHRAIQLRDQFLSLAAHELKTPMTTILGSAQLLQRYIERNEQSSDRARTRINLLIDQTLRLRRLIGSLLDLSRLESGRLTMQPELLDLCPIVRQLVEELQPTLDRHLVLLRAPAEACWINGDRLRLEQVLQNLLQNAVKYSPEGGDILLSLRLEGESLIIQVTDSGIGIPDEDLGRIGERFFRARNVNTHQLSGMGIGLYVVSEIIHAHQGRLEIESVEGQGTSVTIRLPLAALNV